MTVVAIKKQEGKFIMSCDSQITWGGHKTNTKQHSSSNATGKIFVQNGYTIGCSGDWCQVGLMQIYIKTNIPKSMTSDDLLDWMVQFKEFSISKTKGSYSDIGIHLIIAKDDKAFGLYDFMDIIEINDFSAVGSGQWLAIGAMELGANTEKAVEIAIKYDLYCSGEILTVQVK